jgi:hypothetical protein
MLGVAGCGLAVSFDRAKIDAGIDATTSETSTDAPVVVMDADTDASVDAPIGDASDSATAVDAQDD